jgi:hypothetical protein
MSIEYAVAFRNSEFAATLVQVCIGYVNPPGQGYIHNAYVVYVVYVPCFPVFTTIVIFPSAVFNYRSRAKYLTILQYLLLAFTIFEVLEGQIHGGNELETSNCN